MEANVLKFKNDIKALVAKQKENDGECGKWMHAVYTAYFIMKHNVSDVAKFMEEEIARSHKALADKWIQDTFTNAVNNIRAEYEETVCTNKQGS